MSILNSSVGPCMQKDALRMQAAALAGGSGRMRQQLQQHLATLASFRGRASGSAALALPPIEGLQDDTTGEPEVKRFLFHPAFLQGCSLSQ